MRAVAFADPMRELRESMKAVAFADPMRELRESMKAVAFADPMRELRESMKAVAFADPMRELRESMKAVAFADPMRELRESMKAVAFADPMRELRETMEAVAFADPMRQLRESMKAMVVADPMRELHEGVRTLIAVRREAQRFEEIEAEPADSLEIQASASQLAAAVNTAEPTPTQLFHAILVAIEAQKTTRGKWILCNVILPIVISLLVWLMTKVADPYLSQIFPAATSSTQQDARRSVEQTIDSENVLRDLRVVTCNCVRMRANRKKRSRVFSMLEAGQVVVLIHKQGRRAMIGFTDHSHGYCAVGWVPAKHLKRIRF